MRESGAPVSLIVRVTKEMRMKILLVLLAIIVGLSGCSTMYYGAMEKLGVHKREIMVDRVKATRRIARLNDRVIHSFNR
jgi:hypothetical protein